MRNRILLFLLVVFLSTCQQSRQIPTDVLDLLEESGDNQAELEKIIRHYQNLEDNLKLKAVYFLLGSMKEQSYIHYSILNSNKTDMHFNVLDYPDYTAMVAAWDSIEAIHGKIKNQPDTTIYDYQSISADYLINNIDLAFKAWNENPWARHINFDEFCEYILPYRSTNEPLEEWRTYFFEKYQWIKDSVKNPDDPIEAAILINNDIKSWFSFDDRFYRQSTDQGLKEMLKNKMGRCEDMTNLAIYAMRAMAIPVMSDFTPYWAKTGNNHAWNAIINKNDEIIIFMGGLYNPYEYQLNQAKAKVYRKTFAKQLNSLASIKPKWEKVPPYINRNNIIDVTKDYTPVSDIRLTLEQKVPDSTNYAYICVFNTGEWKAIHWSKIDVGNKVNFTDMGRDIVYLPAYFIHDKIVPAGAPFILTKNGQIISLNADTTNLRTVKLISTTEKITANATDNIKRTFLKPEIKYELFYWDNKWKSLGMKMSSKKPLVFDNVPSNALFWLIAEKSKKLERIFTIDNTGKQIWW